MSAHRPVVDNETFGVAQLTAQQQGIPVRLFIDACIESGSSDAFVAESAQRELDAWRDGTSVSFADLCAQLKSFAERNILLIACGNYRDKLSQPDEPVQRAGFGIPATAVEMADLAPMVRGYIPIADPGGPVTVLAFRRGILRLIGVGDQWRTYGSSRKKYAESFSVASPTEKWVDVDNRRSRRKMSQNDIEMAGFLSALVVRPTGNRNSVLWVKH